MQIDVKYPLLFLLVIPALIVIYLFYRRSQSINKIEKNLIISLRSIIFLLLIFALTVPQILLPVKGENVIFLVDRSASMKGTDTQILSWIEESMRSKKKQDSFGIVSIGKTAAVEQSLTSDEEPIQQFSSKVGEDQTNIEQGIQLAASLIPNYQKGRIVLFSDGNETTGNAKEAVNLLKQQNIELVHVKMAGKSGNDAALTEFKVPPTLYKGENAQLKIKAKSNINEDATIRISLNNREILKKAVKLKVGENQFTFSHDVDDTGMFVYKAEIIAENDAFLENNKLFAVSNVTGTPRVLIVQDKKDASLENILKTAKIKVDSIVPEQLPSTLSGYLQYQSVIFNNVDATSIGEKQMNFIEKAVKEFGIGFVMAGGENSFGLGGYFKTPIEKLLPVNMEIKGKRKMPSLGLVIVMDRSGSMSGQKLALAKEAAARSVELLREEDTLGFIAFDDRPWEIVETAPIKDKKNVIKKIRSVTDGGGTEIFQSLKMAYDQLKPLKLQRKHIILLTDGQSQNANYQELIEEGKKDNITISTVGLGQDADIRLLEDLAKYGAGRFYYVSDSTVIPSILSRETVMATRTYIEDHPFYPKVQPYPEWFLFFKNGIPKMNAYIAVTPKQTAQVSILSEKEDPILAEWQYGLGRTIAFTSDTRGKWAGDWARWSEWPSFWSQLVTKTFPSFENIPYEMNVRAENGKTSITLQSDQAELLPLEASIFSQTGKEMKVKTKMTALGQYELQMEDLPGMYFLRIKQKTADNGIKAFQTGFTVPYSKEYLLQGTNELHLNELGKQISKKGAFANVPGKSYHRQSITEWLLLLAFFLFFFEIAIRRFGLQPILRSIRKVDKKEESTKQKVDPIQQLVKSKNQSTKPKKQISDNTDMNKQPKLNETKKIEKRLINKNEQTDTDDRMQRLLIAKKRKR
ncbi:VWA domain-containing protein [Heyndrickxia sp. NPDC080065]|uniref:VWA domain-containing protein n=1 Tax=Heyndrickxia sp. NPDC080065 TaxID=3390568 RepID=UPI003CFE5B95